MRICLTKTGNKRIAMIKRFFRLLPILIIVESCSVEEALGPRGDSSMLHFAAFTEDEPGNTKTIYNNHKILWAPKDEINVFFEGHSARFVSDNEEPASNATFWGSLDGFPATSSGEFYAVYPYDVMNTMEDGNIILSLPSSQSAVENGFANHFFPSISKTSANGKFYFKNVCGGVSFSVKHEGINKVVFRGNNNETLAGDLKVGWEYSAPIIHNVQNGSKTIIICPPKGESFKVGTMYYLAAIPTELSKGYTLSFYNDDTLLGERSNDEAVSIKRSVWGRLKIADSTIEEIVTPSIIDMGTSVMWASHNVGASSSLDYGCLYAWGEKMPKSRYSIDNYIFYDNDNHSPIKYTKIDGDNYLLSEDDVAGEMYGEEWRYPTFSELQELQDKSAFDWVWQSNDSPSGYKVVNKESSATLFFPAPIEDSWGKTYGYYYASSCHYSSGLMRADCLYLRNDNILATNRDYYQGSFIRPVLDRFIRIIGPTSVRIEPEEGEFGISVRHSEGYSIESMPEWISLKGESDSDILTRVHAFTFSANESEKTRSGEIVFLSVSGNKAVFSLIQEQISPRMVVDNNDFSFNYMGGERQLTIDTNRDWYISVSEPWCSVSKMSGSGYATLSLCVQENSSNDNRDAIITISSSENSLNDIFIGIHQDGKPDEESFDWSKSFFHKSLAMLFISTQEGESFRIIEGCDYAHARFPEKLELINIQKIGSLIESDGAETLASHYYVDGPSVVVDGRDLIDCKYSGSGYPQVGSLVERAWNETEEHYPTVFSTIAYQSSLSGRKFSINEQIYCKASSSYKVYTLLTEDEVITSQVRTNKGVINRFKHNNLVRLFLSNALGHEVHLDSDNSVIHLSYSVDIPIGYNLENMKVVVFVEKEYGSQPIVSNGSFGNYYVDNCISGKLGSSQSPAIIKDESGGTEDFSNGEPINW